MAYTTVGLTPDGSSTYYLPRLVGLRRTQELIITNRALTADEALDWGLVTRVVPDDQLKVEAMAMARQLARGPQEALGMVKKLLLASLANGLEVQMELEGRAIAHASMSADGIEGVGAFVEKRKPCF
jgi:2-(1,2-epoxy-1,2-dihydrophenyl)acetyl-CoA isomerase